MRIRMIILVFLAVLPYHALAQKPRLEFEVASVKPNKTGGGSAISGMVRGDRFISTNVTVSREIPAKLQLHPIVDEFSLTRRPRREQNALNPSSTARAVTLSLPPS